MATDYISHVDFGAVLLRITTILVPTNSHAAAANNNNSTGGGVSPTITNNENLFSRMRWHNMLAPPPAMPVSTAMVPTTRSMNTSPEQQESGMRTNGTSHGGSEEDALFLRSAFTSLAPAMATEEVGNGVPPPPTNLGQTLLGNTRREAVQHNNNNINVVADESDAEDFVPPTKKRKMPEKKQPKPPQQQQQQQQQQQAPSLSSVALSTVSTHWVSSQDFSLDLSNSRTTNVAAERFLTFLMERLSIPKELAQQNLTLYLPNRSGQMENAAAYSPPRFFPTCSMGEASVATVLRAFRDAVTREDGSGDGLVLSLGVCIRMPIGSLDASAPPPTKAKIANGPAAAASRGKKDTTRRKATAAVNAKANKGNAPAGVPAASAPPPSAPPAAAPTVAGA